MVVDAVQGHVLGWVAGNVGKLTVPLVWRTAGCDKPHAGLEVATVTPTCFNLMPTWPAAKAMGCSGGRHSSSGTDGRSDTLRWLDTMDLKSW